MIELKKYLYPVLYTISIWLFGALISSILYYFNITSDKLNTIFLYSVSVLGILIGAMKLSSNLKYKGIITGSFYFIFWFLIIILLSFIIYKSSFSYKVIIYYIVLYIFSILGGILGKNIKEKDSD